MSTIPVVILVRVSTKKQETDRQEHELRAVAAAKGWTVIEVCREKVSGKADAKDRAGLTRIMELVHTGKVKKVLVHEVSRLSRRNSVLHTALEEMDDAKVSLYWHSQRMETMLDNGKRCPAAGTMLALLGEMARAETDQLSERIKSGLEQARRNGKTLGRKPGKWSKDRLLEAHPETLAVFKKYPRASFRELAKLTGKSTGTIQRIKRALKSRVD